MINEIYQPKEHKYAFTVRQAQEMRERRKELKEEIRQVNLKRDGVKGQAKRPYTKRLKELDTEEETLYQALAECPPEPLTNVFAVSSIVTEFQKVEDDYQETKDEMVKKITSGHFAWSCSGIIGGLVDLEAKVERIKVFKEQTSIFVLYDMVLYWHNEELRSVLHSNNILNSTSPSANLFHYLEHESRVKMVQWYLPRLLQTLEHLCECVKSGQELNQE